MLLLLQPQPLQLRSQRLLDFLIEFDRLRYDQIFLNLLLVEMLGTYDAPKVLHLTPEHLDFFRGDLREIQYGFDLIG